MAIRNLGKQPVAVESGIDARAGDVGASIEVVGVGVNAGKAAKSSPFQFLAHPTAGLVKPGEFRSQGHFTAGLFNPGEVSILAPTVIPLTPGPWRMTAKLKSSREGQISGTWFWQGEAASASIDHEQRD